MLRSMGDGVVTLRKPRLTPHIARVIAIVGAAVCCIPIDAEVVGCDEHYIHCGKRVTVDEMVHRAVTGVAASWILRIVQSAHDAPSPQVRDELMSGAAVLFAAMCADVEGQPSLYEVVLDDCVPYADRIDCWGMDLDYEAFPDINFDRGDAGNCRYPYHPFRLPWRWDEGPPYGTTLVIDHEAAH